MILRIDRLQSDIPTDGPPDAEAAGVVQELLGGRFGELSTFMNYTFQSFNFRGRDRVRPFYDLIANIAAEEFGHVELVAHTINTMLTNPDLEGTKPDLSGTPLADYAGVGIPPHRLLAGHGALPKDAGGNAWSGDYVFSSGDLIEDLTHNYFLETGARSGKLRVYESVDHPAARALTGYLLCRGGVHQVAYARALEKLTGANMEKLFPSPRIATDKIPEAARHIERGEHTKLYRFSPDDYTQMAAVFNGPHPETGDELEVVELDLAERPAVDDLPEQPSVFAPDYAPEEIAEIADRLKREAGISD